jgi:bifunctional DNase/RNase
VREVEVFGLGVEEPGARPLLLLRELAGAGRVLPIWIGMPEAGAVEVARAHETAPRPGTHRLIADVIGSFDRRLVRASVTGLVGGIFHAELVFDGELRIPARPSDAVVVSILLDAPIEVAEAVFDRAGIARSEVVGAGDGASDEVIARFQRFLETASPEDFDPN